MSTPRLAFSIPVHERADAVLDSVRNFLDFNPGSVVILHAAAQAADLDDLARDLPENVFLNPQRYPTTYGHGLFLLHSSNFRHLVSVGVEFDTFCLASSNELFVREGMAAYAAQVGSAFQAIALQDAEDWNLVRHCQPSDPLMAKFLQRCGAATIYGGQAEGQFFPKELFAEMCAINTAAFGDEKMPPFQSEEMIPQTIATARGLIPHPPVTLVDYSHQGFQVDSRAIRLLSRPELVGQVRLNLGIKRATFLRSPHAGEINQNIFAIKRVPRDPQDPLRTAIRNLATAKPKPLPSNRRREVALVSGLSPWAMISKMIEIAERSGFKFRPKVGLRTLWRRYGARRRR